MNEERTTTEKLDIVSRKILLSARGELYMKMRFLDVALYSLRPVMDEGADGMGTDGRFLYYHPQYLGGLYREDRYLVNRIYLHLVLHGIFRHMVRQNGRDKRIYDLACDIATESMIDSIHHRCVMRGAPVLRRETYRRLRREMKVLTAEKIYGVLNRWEMSESQIIGLEAEFRVDDHNYWPEDDDQEKKQEIENQWQQISEQMESDMETFSSEMSSASGDLKEQVKVENRERYDYREFLKKFAVLREEMEVDPDSFDYTFYSYGLSVYGNMPLIEPQEWKEVKKVEEFVIVIDTSMSCSGALVKKFLEETYGILSETNSFFRKINIHIIQCDDQVQTDQKITSEEELRTYMEHLELRGEGGTDFRPAFAYVEELRKEHAFDSLRGLIYFTDGRGIYPEKMPAYATAFVFLEEDYEDVDVPGWAMKLILEKETLEEEIKGENTWI